jgi:hypothetical protein
LPRISSFIKLTNRALKIEESNAWAEVTKAEAKLLAEENQIMLADLSNMEHKKRTWFKKKQAIILQRDA